MKTLPLVLLTASVSLSQGNPAMAGDFFVKSQLVNDRKSVIATVEPLHLLTARARIGGTVIKLSIKEGDRVEAGNVVAVIVDQKIALQLGALDARILSAVAQQKQAQTDFDRLSTLGKTGAVSRAQIDQASTNLDVAAKTVTALKADRDVLAQQATEGFVLAPTSGRVLKVAVTEGAVVLPGESIASLAEDQYILRLQLPERHAASLRAGDSVDIAGRDGSGPQVGKVRIVYPEIQGGRVIADVDVAGLGSYFVGERTRVTVPTGKREVIVIPDTAVILRAGVHFVRLTDGTEVVVQPGEARGDSIEILSGLRDGDRVVTP
jgi:RND family efflux transporter MFP subunit